MIDEAFTDLVQQLPVLLEQLVDCDPHLAGETLPADLPDRGVYTFSENNEVLYVGRTNRLRQRLREHGAGRHNDAPFAFKLARYSTGNIRSKGGLTRTQLQSDPVFSAEFSVARTRVQKMEWRWVQVDEPNLQCLFEIYASIVLKAKFNDFENH